MNEYRSVKNHVGHLTESSYARDRHGHIASEHKLSEDAYEECRLALAYPVQHRVWFDINMPLRRHLRTEDDG
jgi:hypothetical protein